MVFLVSECVGSLSKIHMGVLPASPGSQIQEIVDRTFSIQLGQIRSNLVKYDPNARSERVFSIRFPIAIKFTSLDRQSADGDDFLQPGP